MTKQEFLEFIREQVPGLPQADLERSLEFYSEAIDDRMEDGLTEEQAVEALGPVSEIATQILTEAQLPKEVSPPARSGRKLRVWAIILIVLGSPIWLILLLALAAVLLGVVCALLGAYAALWAGALVLYAADLSLAAFAVSGIAGVFFYAAAGKAGPAILALGVGISCIGLAVLGFFGCNLVAKCVFWLGKWAVTHIKILVTKRRGNK